MASKKKATPPGDDYYDAMLKSKIAAGLPAETAREVTARQRAEDLANGVTPDEPEPTPEA